MVVIKTSLLSIALLDWTIKKKRQNRNMRYVCVFALKIDFLCSKSWYGARRDCKMINNAETVSSDKKKRSSSYVGF